MCYDSIYSYIKDETILYKLSSLHFFDGSILSLQGGLTGIVSDPRANFEELEWFHSQEWKCFNKILAISYYI